MTSTGSFDSRTAISSFYPAVEAITDGDARGRSARAGQVQAIAIIRPMEDVAAHSEYVFPSFNPKKPLSENAVTGALKRLGYAGVMTAHGFRTTASSLLNDSGEFHPDAIERALAHHDSNTVRTVYNRTQYWAERVRMMQWWSDKIDSLKQLNAS